MVVKERGDKDGDSRTKAATVTSIIIKKRCNIGVENSKEK